MSRTGMLVALVVVLLARPGGAAGVPRIVNGLGSHDFPTAGALLYGSGGAPIDADNAILFCSGTLVGCRTFLTAAHCVSGDPDPTHYQVFLQHAGIVPVASVAANPAYTGLGGNDVAIVKLAADVTGIEPTPINATHDLAATGVGLAGTIAGFGQTSITGRDFGLKRYGAVTTANCVGAPGGEGNVQLVCWDFAIPVGPPGTDSDTCNGDSGGPLFITFAGVTEVVGATSSGSSNLCRPLDHAWDASVFYNAAWIQSEIGADPTTTCGGIGPVGSPAVTVTGGDGALSGTSDAFTVDVGSTTAVLRFALNGQSTPGANVDLYVKQGAGGASPSSYDCKSDGLSVFGACEFQNPIAGPWSILVSGLGQYQVTTTAFAGAGPVCGNGLREGSEQCDDGGANGTAASCCTATCGFQPAGTACADDGDACTRDVCDGVSALCRHPVIDTDGDGLCDAVDPCTNVGHGQDFLSTPHPKVAVSNVNTEPTPGNDTLTITADVQLPAGGSFTAFDPIGRGGRIFVENGAGTKTIVDATLAAGAYGGRGTRGWKTNAAGTTWTFRDTTGAPAGGVTRTQITDESRKGPREIGVSVTGKRSTYPAVPGDEPLHAVVVLGNQLDAEAGACGESAFVAGDCTFDKKGDTLTCGK